MFAGKAKNRPIELGPFPMELLKRDSSVVDLERSIMPSESALPRLGNDQSSLSLSAIKYLKLYSEQRTPQIAAKIAPVPDCLQRRARDLKGGAYFLDAAHVGICELPDNAFIVSDAGTSLPSHAIVIAVEIAQCPDDVPLADKWLRNSCSFTAQLRAAEIANNLAAYIAMLGFHAKAHWPGESDVNIDKLSVLSGITMRKADCVESPYLQEEIVLAAITTNYPAAVDQPLARNQGNPKGLRYFFGTTGATSGFARWSRSRRPSHLGAYPVESLKRMEAPSTLIFEDEIPRIPVRANFYYRVDKGDLGDKALRENPRWVWKHPFSAGLWNHITAMVPLQRGEPAKQQAADTTDPENNARAIKALSYALGASITGITEIPKYCWYSHRNDGTEIVPYHKYAIVMLIDQGQDTFDGASGDDWISGSQSFRSYMRGAQVAGVMADHMRQLGHSTRPQTNLDSDLLHVPLVLWAGLGEQSRIGESTLNPFLGPRFKTVLITTDMPLTTDKPIDFGLQKFCDLCLKCARECPCTAIPWGDKVMFNGYETWKPDSERCTRYRITNMKGSSCGRCVKVCPLNKNIGWDGPWLSRLGSWMGVNMLWAKSVIAPLAIWLDDKLGYGNPNDAKKWWLDFEMVNDEVTIPKQINRRQIDPSHKMDPAKQKIAYYPASDIPSPDTEGAFPVDRKKAVARANLIETVEIAVDRRNSGGPTPEIYKTTWDNATVAKNVKNWAAKKESNESYDWRKNHFEKTTE